VDRCEASLQFAKKLHRAANVDERLENNNVLRDELVEETARLLLEAGYDETDYRQWVARFVS
jgi:hypothetical protein